VTDTPAPQGLPCAQEGLQPEPRPTTGTMVDVFSPTAMHGGRRTGGARVAALVRGGSTSV